MNVKMTQAWGWLVAAVLAAGLNASYHDGGLQRVHELVGQISYQVEHRSAAMLDLATGHADEFLSEARLLTARTETPSCPWAAALERAQIRVSRFKARSDQHRSDVASFDHTEFDHLEAMSALQKAQLARLDVNRTRLENQIRVQVATRMAHFRTATANFTPVSFRAIKIGSVQISKIQAPVVCRLSAQVHE